LTNSSSSALLTRLVERTPLLKEIISIALQPDDSMDPRLTNAAAEILAIQSNDLREFMTQRQEGGLPLTWLFEFLKDPAPINETAAGYFLGIMRSLLDTRPGELTESVIDQDTGLMTLLSKHLYNPLILEALTSLIEKEHSH
jgi:hypothetical protein